MIILGIDPGTTTTGFSIIERKNNQFQLIDYGILKTTPKIDLSQKLLEIGNDIVEIIKKYNPDRIAVEKLFFNTNITTGIAVSHARGVILYEATKRGIQTFEYTPLQVKKAITGNGKADKTQLQNAIKILFGLSDIIRPDDAADAVGIAYMGALENSF
ncbi:crossover junction endodeoxyribonuclease RuvC [Candidatus Gracilibacteria bacterium]|nr:crossover junction endodeoxyribonuclease RuvC [Candidatus Gracilibacteria bacterium]